MCTDCPAHAEALAECGADAVLFIITAVLDERDRFGVTEQVLTGFTAALRHGE